MSASKARTLRIVGGALIVLGLLSSLVPQYRYSLWTYGEEKTSLVPRTTPKPASCSEPQTPKIASNGLDYSLFTSDCGDKVMSSRWVAEPFSQEALAENHTPLTAMILALIGGVVLLIVAAEGSTATRRAPGATGAAAPTSATPAAAASPPATHSTLAARPLSPAVEQQLARLRELHTAGVLSDDELARAQRRAIDNDR